MSDNHKNSILLIDDERVVLNAISNNLTREGYDIHTAANGKEGLEAYHKVKPILILLDLRMPVMDGFEFLEELKPVGSEECFIIVLTGHGSDDDIKRCFDLGVSAFLKKPFNIYELKGLVRNSFSFMRIQRSRIKEIKELQLAEETIAHNYHVQDVISSILRLSLEPLSLLEQLEKTLDLLLSLKWLSFQSKGAIFLTENGNDTLLMKTQQGLEKELIASCSKIPFGKCLCGLAAFHKKVIFADKIDKRHNITFNQIEPHGHYCAPIISGGKVLGVINMYIHEGHKRDKGEEEFIMAVANTLAGIIERKKAEEELRKSEEELHGSLNKLRTTVGGIIQAMALTVEAKDPYTAGHQRRVADLARYIASEMGLTTDQIDGIRMAGAIHDLGKISLPSEILSKPGKINSVEFNLIKQHCQVGYDILKKIDFPWPVAQIVYQHHERLDGSGYPQGLKSDEILVEAKILAVSDVVEAMASHRPYRPTLGIERALEEVATNRGTFYDARIVDTCINLFKNKGFQFEY